MSLSPEIELIGLIYGLFFFDSLQWLGANEVIAVAGRKRWGVQWGFRRLAFGARFISCLNPFALHRPAYRVSWDWESPGAAVELQGGANTITNLGVGPWVWVAAIALLVDLPLVLEYARRPLLLALAAGMIYFNLFVALFLVGRRKRSLSLSSKDFASLCFECIVCPPVGLNLVRKLSLKAKPGGDFLASAPKLLAPGEWQRMRRMLDAAWQEELESEEPEGERYRRMSERRAAVTGGSVS